MATRRPQLEASTVGRCPSGDTLTLISDMAEVKDEGSGYEGSSGSARGRSPLLLQMRSDRRLGHEWDDWDGEALPGGGVFSAGPSLYFGLMTGALLLSALLATLGIWFIEPRLTGLHPALPGGLVGAILVSLLVTLAWLALLAATVRFGRSLLPRWLAEGGPLPFSMRLVEKLGAFVGLSRDRVGSSALQIFNRVAMLRPATHRAGELLVLLPRCLSRESMRAAIDLSVRYGVPAFVASRGRYARQMIGERRPSGVVAVACERDLVSGIADVGRRLPVLGSTLAMPMGPCRDTELDAAALERQLRAMLKEGGGTGGEKSGRGESDRGQRGL